MSATNNYKYLESRPGSSIRQPFVKGRNIWAEVLCRETIGEDARTAEQVAEDFDVPLEAVQEAIDFPLMNEELLREERVREEARSKEYYEKHPPLMPPWLSLSSSKRTRPRT